MEHLPPTALSEALGYADRTTPTPHRSRGRIVRVSAGCVLACLFAVGLLPSLIPSGRHDPQLRCASNLRQIAMACILYADEHGGVFPDSAGTLLAGSDLTAEPLVCCSTRDVQAAGPTTQQFKQQVDSSGPPNSGGCCSYVYVGRGLTPRSPPAAVVAYEPPGHHRTAGGYVVYADARVVWHSTVTLNKIIAAVKAGRNPPP